MIVLTIAIANMYKALFYLPADLYGFFLYLDLTTDL